MSTTTVYRLSALAAILSGACIIIGKLLWALPGPQAGEIFDFFSPLSGSGRAGCQVAVLPRWQLR